jgi:uncharacterized damage-inducible protein DinB
MRSSGVSFTPVRDRRIVDLLSSAHTKGNHAANRQMNTLLSLIDHVGWADAQVLTAIASIEVARPERAQATRLYAHIAGAEHIWLSRLEGRRPVHPVWPDLSLEAAAALATESLAGLRASADAPPEALDRVVEYQTTSGQLFRNTAADILSQVALHGSYHRGQIALLVRQGGGTPVPTDYIVYARR